MTDTYAGPLPALDDPLTAPHWAAAREQRLAGRRCAACGALRWQPASICPECLTTGGEWTDLAGTGTIWSYTVYHRAMNPAFPRPGALRASRWIELDEGLRMVGKLHRATTASPSANGCGRATRPSPTT
jgi:uncharacterized OB-fold protein